MAFHNKYYVPNSSYNLKDEAEFRKDFVSVYEPLRKVEAEQRDGSYYHVMSSFDKLGKLIGVECDPTMMAEMKAYLRGVVHTIEKKNTQAAFLADFEKAQRK
jgi:hypothetical protein